MRKTLCSMILCVLVIGSLAFAQQPGAQQPGYSYPAPQPNYQQAPNYPPPPPPPPTYQNQVTPQVLGEMLRTATSFHELVRSMNLEKNFGPDPGVVGPDGRVRHSMVRTAQTIGAGAGAGAAIGAMSRNQNGVLIGALIGGAGGLILDQVLQHRDDARRRAYENQFYGPVPNGPALGPDGRPVVPNDEPRFREREVR